MRFPILAAALLAAAVPGSAQEHDQAPPATPDGEAVDCISTSRIQRTEVHGDRVIDFVMRGGEVYRNTLPHECPGLGFDRGFSYRTSINQLCSLDTITVLRSGGGIPGPTCGLGKFQPVQLDKAAD